jgi:mannose-6-phosphate isomerase-like protein (cupin superfamily)
METNPNRQRSEVISLAPNAGRFYGLGSMWSVFKADGAETSNRYSVSEWWLDAHANGPGPHAHEANEELFYVIEGTMTFQAGEDFIDAPRGSFLRIPAGVTHDFLNRTAEPAGVLNVFIPGGFEERMPAIVEWYEAQAGEAE